MAHNILSGSIVSPLVLAPPPDGTQHILSGNLSTSDGADVINVPRVSNATNNAILTNIGGDANTLTCETNLTFDGTTLSLTGDLTASIGISASVFYGDGSQLTGITGGGGGGGSANAQGPDHSVQFTTGSGGLSGSAELILSSSVLRISCGLKHRRVSVDANYTVQTKDYYIGVDTAGGAEPITIGLPNASALQDGQTFVIKDEGGQASLKNITVDAAGADKIDGENQVVLASPFAAIQLYCNGNNKFFVC
jgi:hypothetical protein